MRPLTQRTRQNTDVDLPLPRTARLRSSDCVALLTEKTKKKLNKMRSFLALFLAVVAIGEFLLHFQAIKSKLLSSSS